MIGRLTRRPYKGLCSYQLNAVRGRNAFGVHPLQYCPLSDRSERLAKTYRHAHTSTRRCYGYWRLDRLRCRCCLRRRVDVSNKIACGLRWFKAIQRNDFWTASDVKRIVLVSSLQDTVRSVVRRWKRLTNIVLTYEHMRCAAQILALKASHYQSVSLGYPFPPHTGRYGGPVQAAS